MLGVLHQIVPYSVIFCFSLPTLNLISGSLVYQAFFGFPYGQTCMATWLKTYLESLNSAYLNLVGI